MKKALKLTPKQEMFCVEYIKTGNAHQAYITAYNVEWFDKKADWTYTEASKLLNSHKITQRLNEIKAEISSENRTDLAQILFELEQARITAHAKKDVQGMVKATTEKARILGLDKLKELNEKLDQLMEKNNA